MSYASEMSRAWLEKFGVESVPVWEEIVDEELKELKELLEGEQCNDQQLLKEMCDVVVVVYGFAQVMGFNLDRALRVVMENNMLKDPNYKDRRGKVLKPPGHPRPDLSSCV